MRIAIGLCLFLTAVCVISTPAAPPAPQGPFSPREELATFKYPKEFAVDLVASEPDVIDPVALTFDAAGRLFVVEMRGYPNAGVGEGKPVLPGRIKRLEDKDGDGYFETSTIYLDGLRFPTGITAWRDGILVANVPDLLYCADTNGDGKADVQRVLYTGFGLKNIQQLANSLQFHFDNWVHGCNGLNEGSIQSVEKPDSKPVVLRGRHFRFQPDVPGSLEPTSGGGQYGLTCDDWGNWFTCTNSQHLRHVVLPDHYLQRNPHLAVPAVTLDIPDGVAEHTAAGKVFRLSAFEPWRVDRTARRVANPEGRRFPTTELVPGGYVTSATGLQVYRGGAFPPEYDGCVYVADPANNLIHRDRLVPDGLTFKAVRADEGCEFLASTDNWFRPVFLCPGPDGALYVADFYREVIETPLSLPEDIQKAYNLQSRERGRIWRIRAAGNRTKPRHLHQAKPAELVAALADKDAWVRHTAQRLLIQSEQARDADAESVEQLRRLASAGSTPQARLHALWTSFGQGLPDEDLLLQTLKSDDARLVEQGIRITELMRRSSRLRDQVFALARHDDLRVRCQVAYALGGAANDTRTPQTLADLLRRDGADPWASTAILTSCLPHAREVAIALLEDEKPHPDVVARLSRMIGHGSDPERRADVVAVLRALEARQGKVGLLEIRVLEAIASRLSSAEAAQSLKQPRFLATLAHAATLAQDDKAPLEDRQVAVRFLGQMNTGTEWRSLLTAQTPTALQVTVIQALGQQRSQDVVPTLLAAWPGASPAVRRELQEAMFARPERLPLLLDAIASGKLPANALDVARRDQLLKHKEPAVRERAGQLFAKLATPARKEVVDAHAHVLQLTGNATNGKAAFKKNATCHRLEGEGYQVGPDLLSTLKTKTRETLLIDILDPSREVDPRYVNYLVLHNNGQTFSGMITTETASSFTLTRAELASDSILRSDIDQIRSTSKSLMPEELEKQLNPQEMADVIAYLMQVAGKQ